MKLTEPNRYDYDRAERMILKAFGERLRRGEHIFIGEDESRRYFRRSIERAWCSVVDLDREPVPGVDSPTVLRHMA